MHLNLPKLAADNYCFYIKTIGVFAIETIMKYQIMTYLFLLSIQINSYISNI